MRTRYSVLETPAIFPVHNIGAGGNTPPYWEIHLKYPDYPRIETVMVNTYFILKRPNLLQEIARVGGLHRYWRYEKLIVLADSGGYLLIQDTHRKLASKRRQVPDPPIDLKLEDETPQELILRTQEAIRADLAIPLDYPLSRELHDNPITHLAEIEKRLRATARNTAQAYHRKRDKYMVILAPVHAVNRETLELYLKYLRQELRQVAGMDVGDVPGYTIGSLVPIVHSRERLRKLLTTITKTLRSNYGEDKLIHVLGTTGPTTIPVLLRAGVNTMDAKTFIICAAKRLYYTPQTYRRVKLTQLEKLPCKCPICRRHTPETLRQNTRDLTLHNLYVLIKRLQEETAKAK